MGALTRDIWLLTRDKLLFLSMFISKLCIIFALTRDNVLALLSQNLLLHSLIA